MKKLASTGIALLVCCTLLLAGCGGSSDTRGSTNHASTTPSVGTISTMIRGLGALSDPSTEAYVIAADDTAVWVFNGDSGNVIRIDPKTNKVVATIAIGKGCPPSPSCGNIAIGQGAVWVAGGDLGTVTRIDPATNQVVATIPYGTSVGVSPGAVWVSDFTLNALIHIDPGTDRSVGTLSNQPGAGAVSFGAGSLWLCNLHSTANSLTRIDPATNQVQKQIDATTSQGLEAYQVVALDQAVWVVASDGTTSALERIDPATNTVSVSAQVPGIFLAANEQGVWGLAEEELIRFNPQTAQVEGHLALPVVSGIALGAGSIWVARDDGTLLRITPAS